MASRRALVTGATGVVGRYLLKHLVETGGWDIVAVSRRKPDIVGDFVFSAEWDVISDMGKARRAGWTEALDSEDMFLRLFAEFRREKIIP
jgi:uncharacterized protein YbjT (DUF2867 family)